MGLRLGAGGGGEHGRPDRGIGTGNCMLIRLRKFHIG
jgi:hypothetical protein